MRLWSYAFSILTLISCSPEQETRESELATDLGPGSQRVASTFSIFKSKASHCHAEGAEAKRVLISGFGLFTGAEFNISGVVAGALADLQFTPDTINTWFTHFPEVPANLRWGRLETSDHGAVIVQRNVSIDDEVFTLCLITMDVTWDLAAAIIVHEMEAFQPQLVILTGRGSETANFEVGALNQAQLTTGYLSDGRVDAENKPVTNGAAILEGGPEQLWMGWDAQSLASAVRLKVQALGFAATAATQPRPSNRYICNNVSYVALAAAAGMRLSLAGGRIPPWTPMIESAPVIGFFHYPAAAVSWPNDLRSWVNILATVIQSVL